MDAVSRYWDDFTTWVLGDPSLIGLQGSVPTYEELHAEVQKILVPTPLSAGIQVNVLQPINKSLALSGRMFIESAKPDPNPLAALFGGGGGKKNEIHRIFGLGAVYTHRFDAGGSMRLFTQLDTCDISKLTALVDPTGTNRLRISAQLASSKNGGKYRRDWALSSVLRGADYSASIRAVNGPEVGVSYLQRLAPGSPLTLGGELWLSYPNYSAVKRTPGATYPKALEWSFGGAYDARSSKTGVHFTWSGGADGVLMHLHHLYRLNDRCNIVAKSIINTSSFNSMAAAGYKLGFRNTHTTLSGMVDTYGGVRTSVEREVLKDMKVMAFLHYNPYNAAPQKDSDANIIGFKVTVGGTPRMELPMSPCTMNKLAFKTQ